MSDRINSKALSELNFKNVSPENQALRNDQEISPKLKKKQRRDKSDLGEDFVAPDGGWAWMICIAAGMSYLSIYPCLQQFGLIFRERLMVLGITNSQITTIINTNSAVSACTGLLNGPMFRRFTFRQVAIVGALIVFVGIIMVAFCESFLSYITSYSLIYGFGLGICVSSSSLAVNTYFQKKRRRATGFSWTITGLGPIFWPYAVSLFLPQYGVLGTCLIFAAISLHALLSGIIYQPVRLHTTKTIPARPEESQKEEWKKDVLRCDLCEQRREKGVFSSQYLYQDNDFDKPGYEIIEPGTPMLSRANDGWFGSKLSLASNSMRFRTVPSSNDLELCARRLNPIITKETDVEEEEEEEENEGDGEEKPVEYTINNNAFFKPNNFNRERDDASCRSRYFIQNTNSHSKNLYRCTCPRSEELQQGSATEYPTPHYVTFWDKLIVFFDLGLLRDITFVNLVVGLTIINFGELNFSILTPFILSDIGFSISQTTLLMSILAVCDITIRFLVPFITEKIPWDNRVFFLIGVVGIAFGRTVVACNRSFPVILCAFCWIGVCKGVRTIFWPLIIPSYVPLNRLPAASGLQLLVTGLFSLMAGPLVGLIRDRFNYSICLHFLNTLSFLAAFSWSLEAVIRRTRQKRSKT